MNKKAQITEKQILSIIEGVIEEGRKVIKVNGGTAMPNSSMPQISEVPSAPSVPNGFQGGDNEEAPNAEGLPKDGGVEDATNQFDTNFDAGVEADEETDPKRYIQQLTGKLSQSLNSFNDEQGGDAGLSKYVANMIIAAACKNLDEKAKKDIIEKINTTNSDEEENASDEDDLENMATDDNTEMPAPMQEGKLFSKKELNEFLLGRKSDDEKRPTEKEKRNNNIPKAWRGKKPILGAISK